jgi:hypothetical protein
MTRERDANEDGDGFWLRQQRKPHWCTPRPPTAPGVFVWTMSARRGSRPG